MRRSARQLGKAPVAPVGREGAATRASSSHSMADDEANPRHMIPIYEKHKKLHATEVKKVSKSFGQVLEGMFCKRLASILVEANANATSINHPHHKPGDVTFHAPAGNAANAGHTRAPIHTSPEAHKSPASQEVDADKEVAGTEDVQQGPVLGEHEKTGTMAALQGLAVEFDDGPSMSLFKEGTEDFEWLNMDDNTARKYREENNGIETPIHASAGPTYEKTPKRATQGNNTKLPAQNDGDGPCFDTEPKLPRPTNIPRQSSPIAFADPLVPPVQQVSPELHDLLAKIVSDSSARVKHVKKAVKKRTAQPPVNAQRMKKIKIEPKDDALYQQYVLSSYNCGFYAILYLENYNGVVMMHFDESYIPNLRKRIAANLLKHPSNNLDPAEQLTKLLED
ncbi:hypothetical protein ZWY2020_029172 [Hordeum vulgare]|nr:hypothetical protein ZWY2020_029172 [Hordeum vulgare]